MKKHLAKRLISLKAKPYGLALKKTDMINQEKWPGLTFPSKY